MVAVPAFAELLQASQRDVVHMEMRDGYKPTSDAFQKWLDGKRIAPGERPEWALGWYDLIGSVISRGVAVRRARIVSEPVSDYIRYEHDVTEAVNVAAGEQVKWLPRSQASGLCLPGNDFWMFDTRIIRFNHFDGEGSPTFQDISTDPDVINLCDSAFEAVWQRAIPHGDYRPGG